MGSCLGLPAAKSVGWALTNPERKGQAQWRNWRQEPGTGERDDVGVGQGVQRKVLRLAPGNGPGREEQAAL